VQIALFCQVLIIGAPTPEISP